jgi:hypothetical protein
MWIHSLGLARSSTQAQKWQLIQELKEDQKEVYERVKYFW